MTAINILVHGGGAMLFTDAVASIDGEITWIGNKATLWPQFRAAGAATGDSQFPGIILRNYFGGGCTSYDGLISTMEESARLALADYADSEYLTAEDSAFDIHTVGWSDENDDFRAWTLSYAPGGIIDLYEAGPIVLQPGSPDVITLLDLADIIPETILEMPLDTAFSTMARIMAIQRGYARGQRHAIGGFQQATLLTDGPIITRIVEVWAGDKVGGRT